MKGDVHGRRKQRKQNEARLYHHVSYENCRLGVSPILRYTHFRIFHREIMELILVKNNQSLAKTTDYLREN